MKKKYRRNYRGEGGKLSRVRGILMLSMMDGHNIHLIERAGTRRTFAHAIADAIIDTLVTEQMAACLQGRILEVVAANST
jgi:hypothetical protein